MQSERVDLLSDAEFKYVTNFFRSQKNYFVENFLKKLPGKLNDFGAPSKIPKKMSKPAASRANMRSRERKAGVPGVY